VEGFRGCRDVSRRRTCARTEGAVRIAGLCLRRVACEWARFYDELGNKRRANALRKKAAALFQKVQRDFWDEESGFYAFALDGEKKKVLSVASNVGHCLWSGIVAPERAGCVAKRLMRKDMWTGWGIRTLSADHPAFNPYNYQTGAVWPHDNSLIAMGMRRYGFVAEASAVARDISGAASHFLLNQLPELYGGLQRDPTSFPVQYFGRKRAAGFGRRDTVHAAAGDAGAAARMRRAASSMSIPRCRTGYRTWTLTDLRLGRLCFDIRFWRDGKDTSSRC